MYKYTYIHTYIHTTYARFLLVYLKYIGVCNILYTENTHPHLNGLAGDAKMGAEAPGRAHGA